MYFYKSPIGTFRIVKRPDGFHLSLNGEDLDVCESAVAAADNVYVHSTGCYEWDKRDGKVSNVPTDLRVWEVE